MKNKLILHIGTPKTGTTAIQKFLYDNESILNEQHFSYPTIQKGKHQIINAYALDQYLKNGVPDTEHAGWKDFWTTLREKLQNDHVILSWEGIFFDYAKEFFSAVKKEYDVIQIIVYLRRQDRFLESIWNQYTKGEPLSKLPFKDFIANEKFKWSYLEKLNKIADIVGQENLIVRVYEKDQFQGARKDIISDFLQAVGINLDWSRCVLGKPANSALFGNYVEIKRRMNLYLQQDDNWCIEIQNIFMAYIEEISSSSSIKHADGMLTPKERQEIIDYYAEENAEIARKYLGRADGKLFYENKPIPMHKLDDSTLCDDILSLFEFLLKSYQKYMNVRCIATKIKSSLPIEIEESLNQLASELNQLQEAQLSKEIFEEKCFKLVEKYTIFLLKVSKEKFEFYNKNLHSLKEKCFGKKCFCLGTGGYCQYFLQETDLYPDAFLDNHAKDRDKLYDLPILHPSQIEDWSNSFVIITVKKSEVIAAMEQQLQGYGLKKDEDYLVGPEYFMDPF